MNDNYEDIINLQRPVLKTRGMDVGHRAKIFAPFAALKGFEESVKQKEFVYESRCILTDDHSNYINNKLKNLVNGEFIKVVYFQAASVGLDKGQYKEVEGAFEFDKDSEILRIGCHTVKISDLIDVQESKYY